MTLKEAKKLKSGDKVKQKANGFILTVKSAEVRNGLKICDEYVSILCEFENGSTIRHNHKEVMKA